MLTPSELTTLGFLLAVGLTVGAFVALVAMGIACAMSGMTNETEPDQGLDDLQLDSTREDDPVADLHVRLREAGYYGTLEHARREAKVRRAMGGSDAA